MLRVAFVAFVAFAYKIIRSVEFVMRRHWVLGFSIRCSHYKCWYSLRRIANLPEQRIFALFNLILWKHTRISSFTFACHLNASSTRVSWVIFNYNKVNLCFTTTLRLNMLEKLFVFRYFLYLCQQTIKL